MVPFLHEQVQVVLEYAPDGDVLEILNKCAVSSNALSVVLIGLDDHLPISVLPQTVPADEQIVLEALPSHEKITLAPSILDANLIVAFEFQSVVAVDVVVRILH